MAGNVAGGGVMWQVVDNEAGGGAMWQVVGRCGSE